MDSETTVAVTYILVFMVIFLIPLCIGGAIAEYGPALCRKYRRYKKKRRIETSQRAAAQYKGSKKDLCTRRRKPCRSLARTSR
ncbi:hypothetical protein [Ethanoligenens sp.]|uniref:hypothetical protein n=1 Tax=Ethanoligenens sp. TaxID=2099655 RepID=UPI0039ED8964